MHAAVGFGRSHVAAVLVLVLVGLLWAAGSMFSARTVPLAAPSPTVSLVAATPLATPSVMPIQVHVIGGVLRPGVVRLTPGARVGDAVAAAGGLVPEAHPGDLNLAAVIPDGSQVVIGTPQRPESSVRPVPATEGGAGAAEAAGAGAAAIAAKVDLNRATEVQLDTLPGVGPVTAQAIIAWRTQHGPFKRVEDLQDVDGIGPKTFAQLADKVTV